MTYNRSFIYQATLSRKNQEQPKNHSYTKRCNTANTAYADNILPELDNDDRETIYLLSALACLGLVSGKAGA